MRTIKKYGNRRLYDTVQKRYINLEELCELVRSGEDVTVVDARSGRDLTKEVLLQVVLDVLQGADFFPPRLLHRIIRSTGDAPWQRSLRQQLATGIELLSAQMDHVERIFGTTPPSSPPPTAQADEPPEEPPEPPRANSTAPEVDELRARLAALEERLRGSG